MNAMKRPHGTEPYLPANLILERERLAWKWRVYSCDRTVDCFALYDVSAGYPGPNAAVHGTVEDCLRTARRGG